MDIGFIGLGHMGSKMAANLIGGGHTVTVYNRTRAKADALAGQGAVVADTVADACRGDVVVTMLANDDAVAAVTFGEAGIVASLRPGAVHVSSSTISVALAERLTAMHGEAGQRYLSAPVFGPPEAAAAAKLFVIPAGDADTIKRLRPVFEAVGQRTLVVGDRPAMANVVKISGNFMIASVIESLGEAMALISKAGLDKQQFLDVLTSTMFGAPIYHIVGSSVVRGEFQPVSFLASRLGLKDVRLALAAGEELQVPLPLANLVHDRFLTLLAEGNGELDWTAVSALAARDAGLPTSLPTPRSAAA